MSNWSLNFYHNGILTPILLNLILRDGPLKNGTTISKNDNETDQRQVYLSLSPSRLKMRLVHVYKRWEWGIVCRGKWERGLGVKDMEVLNKALIGKWRWMALNEEGSLVCR